MQNVIVSVSGAQKRERGPRIRGTPILPGAYFWSQVNDRMSKDTSNEERGDVEGPLWTVGNVKDCVID